MNNLSNLEVSHEHYPSEDLCIICDRLKDKAMWLGIRSGIIGLKRAISFTTRSSPALGMVLSALGRIEAAIDVRWDLVPTKEAEPQ